MNKKSLLRGISLVAFGWAAFTTQTAEAGIEACGNISVQADAQCEVVVEGGCEVMCEPVRFEAVCAAELSVACDGQCNAEASVDCAVDCAAECGGQCEIDPGEFNCYAACEADCGGQCDAKCSSEDGECRAACEATCGGHCESECNIVPASANCEAKCEAACEGSCQAEANIDCQIDCQADGFVDCKAELEGGCKAECQRPEGALFCDGEWIRTDNLDECVAALRALFDIEVEGYAEGRCVNGRCEGEAGGAISCAVDDRPERTSLLLTGLFVLVLGGSGLARRNRERA